MTTPYCFDFHLDRASHTVSTIVKIDRCQNKLPAAELLGRPPRDLDRRREVPGQELQLLGGVAGVQVGERLADRAVAAGG